MVAKVKKGAFEFNEDEEWCTISAEAKDLIKKLVVTDPAKRISAKQALQDPWILKSTKEHEIEDD